MTVKVETTLRGPQAYTISRKVIDEMEKAAVWPTPLNFEIWLHYMGDPEGPLGREINRMLAAREPFTDEVAEQLAAEFLPRGRVAEEIRDAGLVLDRELSSVAAAISQAHKAQTAYGQTLDKAAVSMDEVQGEAELKAIVGGLSTATRKILKDNVNLEQKLEVSTREVERLREHLEQVRRDALTDALTNLANRKAFDDALASACRDADAQGHAITLALLDIDHFKKVNDTWGHQTGDQVIRYVASVLNRHGQHPRIAARYGGEEFAMLFVNESTATVEKILQQVRSEIASRSLRRRSTNDDLGAVTISAGYAVRVAEEAAAALMERADAALYASKRNGRNQVTREERIPKKDVAA